MLVSEPQSRRERMKAARVRLVAKRAALWAAASAESDEERQAWLWTWLNHVECRISAISREITETRTWRDDPRDV